MALILATAASDPSWFVETISITPTLSISSRTNLCLFLIKSLLDLPTEFEFEFEERQHHLGVSDYVPQLEQKCCLQVVNNS